MNSTSVRFKMKVGSSDNPNVLKIYTPEKLVMSPFLNVSITFGHKSVLFSTLAKLVDNHFMFSELSTFSKYFSLLDNSLFCTVQEYSWVKPGNILIFYLTNNLFT